MPWLPALLCANQHSQHPGHVSRRAGVGLHPRPCRGCDGGVSHPAEQLPTASPPAAAPQPLTAVAPRPARDARYDWAAERTLLAWIRTGLAMMGFGFVVARFGAFLRVPGLSAPGAAPDDGQSTASIAAGVLMIALGMLANLVALRRFLQNHRALSRGEPIDPSPLGPSALAVFSALLGVALALMLGLTLAP
jgi:putative membrane protein